MKKLCYILPEYNEDNVSHFYHLYEFLQELSKRLDIFLIVEKSNVKNVGDAISHIKRVYVQRFRFLPLRCLESFFTVLRARILGYKNFYTHYCYIGAINAAIISRLFGGKSYYWNCAMNWLFKQRTLPGLGYRLSMKLSHYLVTGGEIMKQGYAENYGLKPEKIKLIPNRINLNRFKPTADHPQGGKHYKIKTILFVHWLSKRKGADTIIPIAKGLEIRAKFIIVGDGPYKEKLLREIKQNKLEKFIEVVGPVPNKDIVDYYKKADILILPSSEEGFPLTLLEAMAMGVPYVAFDVGAVREISPRVAQEFIVKPGDIKEFTKKIQILLSSKEIYDRFRKGELEKVKEYSLDNVINKFINLFS